MDIFRRLTLFSLALATCMLLPHNAQAWFGSEEKATQKLYAIVRNEPLPQYSLTDQSIMQKAADRMQRVEDACNAGANVKYVDEGGLSMLHWSAMRGDAEMVNLLLQKGADPTAPDQNGLQPWAYVTGSSVLCTLLHQRSFNNSGITPEDEKTYQNLIKAIKEREKQEQGGNGPGLGSTVASWFN
jgi:ankyrin repeat protein